MRTSLAFPSIGAQRLKRSREGRMSAEQAGNLMNRIISSVVARYLRGSDALGKDASTVHLAAWTMDMFARLSMLEGAAGVPPGSWLAKRERGFGSALDHFGPSLAAAWTTAADQGVYDKAVQVASSMLRQSGTDAEELVQDMLVGSTSAAAPRRSRLFYSVGENLKRFENDLGTITPSHSRVKGVIDHWVRRAARDVFRKERDRKTDPYSSQPGEAEAYGGLHSRGTEGLSNEQRDNLVLLALQSPGGPGNEIRRTIDHLIDRSFTSSERAVVRMFLEKIADPKYRSPEAMKQLVNKFNPNKWFTQAFNLVRKDILAETGMSPQQLTNVLGGNAARVFKFMHDVVGKDPKVQSIIGQLADEIELLEPGVGQKVGRKRGEDHEADLPPEQTPVSPHSVLREWFEEDQSGEWGDQATPHTQWSKGPVPARVASQQRRAMLHEIVKAALANPTWRSVLVPLVRLAKLDESTRVASGVLSLRAATIRTAFEATDADLRRTLVSIVREHDDAEKTSALIPLTLAQSTALIRMASATRDPKRRWTILALLRQAKYSPRFLKFVENKTFLNRDTDRDVKFHSLPPAEQKRIYDQWKDDRKQDAEKLKPDGISKETKLTPEKFDEVKEGDILWISYSPRKLHRVTGVGKTRGGKPVLEMVQFDKDNPEKEGEKRYLHRSTTENDDHEIHALPAKEKPKDEKPKDEKPKDDHPDLSYADALEEFEIGDQFFEDGFPDKPLKIKKVDKNADGKLFRLVAENGTSYYPGEIHRSKDGYLRIPKKRPEKEAPEKKEPPKAVEDKQDGVAEKPKVEGKHKDRKELLGKKSGFSEKMKVGLKDDVVKLAIPDDLPEEDAKKSRERMQDLDVAEAKALATRLQTAVDHPDGKRMAALMESGFTAENIKKLHEALTKRLRSLEHHVYVKKVLEIANKYDLEAEDADDLRDYLADKPAGGKKLTDAQLMQAFLQKAQPETRKRMQGMSVADFMAMYKAIMAEENEDAPAAAA